MGEISAYIVAPYTRPVRTVQWEVGGLLPPVYPIVFFSVSGRKQGMKTGEIECDFRKDGVVLFLPLKKFLRISMKSLYLQSLSGGKNIGELAEWSMAAVLKTVELKGSGGSNPSLSAVKWPYRYL